MSSAMRWVGVLVLVAGCGSPCERLCDNMADYAEECGFAVPDADLDACKEAQKSADSEQQDVCSDYGTPEGIRNEWTCDDLQAYWSGGTSPTASE